MLIADQWHLYRIRWWTKKGLGQVDVSALHFLQCFDTDGWVTGRTSGS